MLFMYVALMTPTTNMYCAAACSGGPTTVTGANPSATGFVGELFRLTSADSNQVIVKGSNTYVGADLYHEGCAHEYAAAEDSSIVVISATKMCPPWTDTAKIPVLEIKPKFSGFFYFESALAACKPHPHEHVCHGRSKV